jgi:hypothetical protein
MKKIEHNVPPKSIPNPSTSLKLLATPIAPILPSASLGSISTSHCVLSKICRRKSSLLTALLVASVARIRIFVSGTPKSAQTVLNFNSDLKTSSMTSWGIGPLTPAPPLVDEELEFEYCASYSDIPSRSV